MWNLFKCCKKDYRSKEMAEEDSKDIQDSFYDEPPAADPHTDEDKGKSDEVDDQKEDNVGYEDDFEDETDVKIKLTSDDGDAGNEKDLNSPTININGTKIDENAISPVSRSRQIRESGINDDSPPGKTQLNVGDTGSNESTPPGSTLKKVGDTGSVESTPPGRTLQKAADDCKEAQEENYTSEDYIAIFNDSRGIPLTSQEQRLFSTGRGIPIDMQDSIPDDGGPFFAHEPIHTL